MPGLYDDEPDTNDSLLNPLSTAFPSDSKSAPTATTYAPRPTSPRPVAEHPCRSSSSIREPAPDQPDSPLHVPDKEIGYPALKEGLRRLTPCQCGSAVFSRVAWDSR
jgi:hypothetical protein